MSVEKETLARHGSTETCNPREAGVGRSQGQGLLELLRKFSLSGKGESGGRGRGGEIKCECERQREDNLAMHSQCSVSW